MFLRKRDCRCLVIILVFFLVVNFVFAKEIEVDIPKSVEGGEEFKIEIKLIDFADGDYDLKIDILGDGERIAKIEGKSTYYFIEEIFKNNVAKVSLEITENFEGEAEIVIKVRKSGGSTTSFDGYAIDVEKGVVEEKEVVEEEKKEEIVEEKPKKVEENQDKEIILPIDNDFKEETIIYENNVISLEPQSIKNTQDREIIFRSKNQIIKEYGVFAFAFFCIVIICLLLIERKNV